MAELTNPHERFFKELLAHPEAVRDFLRHYLPDLPAEVVELLGTSHVEMAKDSFVDAELQEYFSDLLFQVRTSEGGSVSAQATLSAGRRTLESQQRRWYAHGHQRDRDTPTRWEMTLKGRRMIMRWILRVRVGHLGASGTQVAIDFENDLLIVLLTQVPQAETQPFRQRLMKAIYAVFEPAGPGQGGLPKP